MNFKDSWQVMAVHTIHYKGEEAIVKVIQTTNRIPHFFFLIHFPSVDVLLSRFDPRPEIWNASSLTLEEGRELGEFIEQQIGYRLPDKVSNNPFQYNGDIKLIIEAFKIQDLIIDRAKAPYTNDIYYQVHIPENRKVIMVKMEDFFGDCSWSFEEPINLSAKDFNTFKSLLIPFEEAYQLGIYKPI